MSNIDRRELFKASGGSVIGLAALLSGAGALVPQSARAEGGSSASHPSGQELVDQAVALLRAQGRYELGHATENVGAELHVYDLCPGTVRLNAFTEQAPGQQDIKWRPARPLSTTLSLFDVEPNSDEQIVQLDWNRHNDYGHTSFVGGALHRGFLKITPRGYMTDDAVENPIGGPYAGGPRRSGVLGNQLNNVNPDVWHSRGRLQVPCAEDFGLYLGGTHVAGNTQANADYAELLTKVLAIEAGDHPIVAVRPVPNEWIDGTQYEGHSAYVIDAYRTHRENDIHGSGDAFRIFRGAIDLDYGVDEAGNRLGLLVMLENDEPDGWDAKVSLGGRDVTGSGQLVRYSGPGVQSGNGEVSIGNRAWENKSAVFQLDPLERVAAGAHEDIAPRLGKYHLAAPGWALD